jgi:hypothetical protein
VPYSDEIAGTVKMANHNPCYPWAKDNPIRFAQLEDARSLQIVYKNVQRVLEEDAATAIKLSILLAAAIRVFEPGFPARGERGPSAGQPPGVARPLGGALPGHLQQA